MLGILLNSLKSLYTVSEDLSNIANFGKNIFGSGTISFTGTNGVNSDITLSELEARTSATPVDRTLELYDLEIGPNGVLRPDLYTSGNYPVRGPYHPLIFKCAGTLTVRGAITAEQRGGRNIHFNRDGVTIHRLGSFPAMPLKSLSQGSNFPNYGWSADPTDFYRLYHYGMTNTFLDQNFFLVGGGQGGQRHERHWHHLHWKHHHGNNLQVGISIGGGHGDGRTHGSHSAIWSGNGGGGFVALYFNKLYIDGEEYGVSPWCDVSRISANGCPASFSGNIVRQGFFRWTIEGANPAFGGGCMVIAARTIKIDGGIINSDAVSGVSGGKHCFLNNLPQLASNQGGLRYTDSHGISYQSNGDRLYRWYPGAGSAWKKTSSNASDYVDYSGGAGLALGFKVEQ